MLVAVKETHLNLPPWTAQLLVRAHLAQPVDPSSGRPIAPQSEQATEPKRRKSSAGSRVKVIKSPSPATTD